MIPFPFEYIEPDTLEEAASVYAGLSQKGLRPLYYAGGTEIITMARVNSLAFDALIDIKHIPQCRGYGYSGEKIVFGAAATLNDVALSGLFPLLEKACARVADHTAQCKITLGGNVAGTIFYHEAALPLLLADATVLLASPAGTREAPLRSLYHQKLILQPGEIIVCFSMDPAVASLPYVHAKHTQGEKIGYPLFTLAALRTPGIVRAAIAGYYPFPVMVTLPLAHLPIEPAAAASLLMGQMAGEPISDTLGSGQYRRQMLEKALQAMLEVLGG